MFPIGNREIVGHGITGDGIYEDHMAFPASAIRFKEPTEENAIIRQKEKGDWKALSMTEKKECKYFDGRVGDFLDLNHDFLIYCIHYIFSTEKI